MGAWTRLIWLRIGTGGGALVSAAMNFRVPSDGGVSCLVENLLASPEGLCCMDVRVRDGKVTEA